MNRRTCLQSLLAASLGTVGYSRRASAIEPLNRQGYQFKFSLAAYSYRRLLQGDDAKLTLFDFVDDCAKFGLEGTELTSYYFPGQVTDDYLYQLQRHCFLQGLDVSGTAVGNDFGYPPGSERSREMTNLRQWIDRAQKLHAPVIRIFAGHHKDDISAEESHRLMVSGMQQACEYAGTRGIHLALENHGGPTSTAEGLLQLVSDVESPWFGVNLDTGNFRGQDVYEQLAAAAPYAINVQVKVAVSGPDGKKQPTDFKRLADILKQANYRGYIVLEFEERGDPRTECPRYLDALRDAFA